MNDQNYATNVKAILKDCISQLDFVKNYFFPILRKILPEPGNYLLKILSISVFTWQGGGALQQELLKYYSFSKNVPYSSVFCQQKAKVSRMELSGRYSGITRTYR